MGVMLIYGHNARKNCSGVETRPHQCQKQGDKINLRSVDLKAHTGIVLRLDFDTSEDKNKH